MFDCRRGGLAPQFAALALGLVLTHAVAASAQPVLPTNFQETVALSGLEFPTAVKFAADGRVFVAEKSGLIKVFDSLTDTTPTVFADLRTQVHNFWDRGLLGLELHPAFPDEPYVYVLYTLDRLPRSAWVDPNPNDGIVDPPIPQWGSAGATSDGCPSPPGPTSSGCPVTGRLSRLEAFGNSAGPEQALIEDWCQQYPSHSIGALAFGHDGALYVSGGDGASFNFADYGQGGGTGGVPVNVCGDPPGPVGTTPSATTSQAGALRSQSLRRPNQPAVLDGTILRIDASTGEALPDNPLAHSTDPDARRVVAYGLRNPFRIAVRPGTSEVWIGDVGWNTWEEIDHVANPLAGVLNFGWPCYEGAPRQSGYDGLNNTLCENLYSGIVAPGVDPVAAGTLTAPFYTYNHNADVVSGDVCPPNPTGQVSSSVAGLAFYEGGPYPGNYTGALFFADYSRDCIWAFRTGADGKPDAANRIMFVGRAANPVGLEIGPNGDLFYVDFDGGNIRRVRYLGANNAPVASLTADQTTGTAPLTVLFSAAGSTDLDADPLTYAWDLDGDGQFDDTTGATTSRTFNADGVYTVRVRVSDDAGASDEESIEIRVGNVAPTATIASPSAGLTWKVGDVINFSGSANDPQDGNLTGTSLTWTLIINHCPNNNCHQHVVQSWNGSSGSFVAPDHEYPSSLELQFRAVDSGGLSDTKSVVLQPQTVTLTVASSPGGLTVGFNATSAAAPIVQTVIVGSSNSISAPSPQTLGSVAYTFQSWSDGGAAAHNVVAPATNRTYTATFTGSSGLPSPWVNSDIGTPALAGSATWNGSAFTVRGGGNDIWDNADSFHFVYQPLNGNGEIRARVASLTTNTDGWAKTGVMIRQSLTAGSPHAMMIISPGNGTSFQRRISTNGTSFYTQGPVATAPYWVRLVRAGNLISGYTSPNGTTWTFVQSVGITMPANVFVGLPVTSHNNAMLATAVLDQVVVSAAPPPPPPPPPSGLPSQDIGNPTVPGSSSLSGSTYTITGGGADIWDTSDSFRYTYQQVSGDSSVVARVDSLQNTDSWAKAGVMIRESLAANSRHVMMIISPGNGTSFQRRTTTGGFSDYTQGPAVSTPRWVRVVRSGNTFTASTSANGTTWTTVGSVSIAMASSAYAGLAVTSHDDSEATTATFTQVTIVP